MKWAPAIDFGKCYLSVYPGKEGSVYLTRETYMLLGRPKKIAVFPMGKTVCFSPANKYGVEVMFSANKQPFVIHPEAARTIGPGNRATFSYDEEDRDILRGGGTRRYFYFRVNNNVPATPRAKPKTPAKR
jgi:hypothetical protein